MMQVDKFTALGRNAIGAAQSAALAANHQKLMAEHILAALLKDNNMTVKMLLAKAGGDSAALSAYLKTALDKVCLLYTSPSPRDRLLSRMPSSA